MSLTIKRKYEIIILGKLRAGVVEDSLEEVSLRQDFKGKDSRTRQYTGASHPHGNHVNDCMQIEARVYAKETGYVPVQPTDTDLLLTGE